MAPMTARAEIPPKLAQDLERALEEHEAAGEAVDRLIARAVKASSYGAVARFLGITRQAVQDRLRRASARARRA